jgi:hypothetical protein
MAAVRDAHVTSPHLFGQRADVDALAHPDLEPDSDADALAD